jgi:hypothetical protein
MLTLNYLAVLCAAVAAFAIGGLWYSPALFANAWQTAHGVTGERLAAMKSGKPPARALIVTFLCQLVTAVALAVLKWWMAFDGWFEGLVLGVTVWGGFVATTGLMTHVYSDKPPQAYVIDAAYQLIYLAVMGMIIGEWR